jgi:hypothetical protein
MKPDDQQLTPFACSIPSHFGISHFGIPWSFNLGYSSFMGVSYLHLQTPDLADTSTPELNSFYRLVRRGQFRYL